ncbi:hypothetical protein GCM10025858_13260 [Alicyclobacillus sacchari]|uniref:cupredoxin domain-containing protein n=1 Tax=Alicyclobacillus sacchari TaxID=392010 RepID=UPI0023E92394|nr:plastocyanin/azurin family copper-binding protein [Alicyclobacillus sacchari]GMA56823.1 hypothetical protein GCM10025858_13260 [Alicyclobacillus sacchari]
MTFTKPGVYPYYCLLHPGMMGVVIVNPAGTPYPMTQAQYNAEGQSEQQADFTAGDQAVSSFQLKAQKNPNGTTTYFAQTDAPEPQTYTFDLSAQNSSTVRGSALIAFSLPPSQSNPETTYSIAVKLAGLTPGQSYTAVLSEGTSGSGVTVPQSQFGTVTVNADGTGTVTGSVNAMALPQGVWTLDIEDATHHIVASGRIDHPSWAYERFLPDTLHIHTGDTVVWTQTGINEVHTVTFLPSGWSDIPNESLMPVPYGGHIYAGTGFYNSGFMVPGATYDLTFIKSGNFAYRCLLHDVMGMLGTVDVTPQPNVLTIALNNSVDNVPSRTVGKTTYVPIWYVMHMLQSQGLHSTWNGSDWKVSSTTPINAHSQAGSSGNIHLYLNNQLLFSGDSQVWSLNGHATTFVPVHQVVGALQSLGFDAAFDGSTLDMTPQAHAGSVPAPTAAQSMGTGGSQSSSASGTSGNAMSGMN